MKNELNQAGFVQNYFPFTQVELKKLEKVAQQVSLLDTDKRKRVFEYFPLVRKLFQQAISTSNFELELTEYCFYVEKSSEKNWPLLFHRDINLPEYMNIKANEKEEFLENSVMFRLNLDSSDKDTGALKVIVGSHINKDAEKEVFITTKKGEVVFFKPLLLHGSNKVKRPHQRRVFQALCLIK